jgi:hypothetical protein
MEFHHPAYSTPIITSPIQEIREPIESVRDHRRPNIIGQI